MTKTKYYNVDFVQYSYTVAAETPRQAVRKAVDIDLERCLSNDESDERLLKILDTDNIDVYELGPQGFDDAIPHIVTVEELCEDLV